MTNIIELANVSKVYPGADSASVDNISLGIEEGEFLCFLGPSGCGKSTTLRMIAGLEPVTGGTITIRDEVVDDTEQALHVPAERRGLGFVFQNYALWPHMSVYDNVAFGPREKKLPKSDVDARVQTALKTLAIAEYTARYPSELSGGQQQRVAIARTLADQTDILLLDEPLSNLDARLRLEMRGEFSRIHRETGATMIFVTHDQWEAMTLATRIAVMNVGVIEQVGTPLEVYNKPVNRFVAEFLGSPSINIIDDEPTLENNSHLWDWIDPKTRVTSLGVRPELVHFDHADDVPEGSLSVPVRIESLMPTGGSWIIEALPQTGGQSISDGARLFATAPRPAHLTEGESLLMWAPVSDIHLFDQDGIRIPHPGE